MDKDVESRNLKKKKLFHLKMYNVQNYQFLELLIVKINFTKYLKLIEIKMFGIFLSLSIFPAFNICMHIVNMLG